MRLKISSPKFVVVLFLITVTSAWAQVPSHTPTSTSSAFTETTTFQPVGRAVVRVNGVALTDRDLLREMLSIFPYARVHNGFPKSMEADIRAGAMKMMVFEELVYQEARRRNMAVPSAQLAQATADFRKQFNTPQEYRDFIQQECKGSEKLLQAKVERSLLIDKFLKQEVTDKAVVSAAEVKTYFDQHQESFRLPESFSFQSISFLPRGNASAQMDEARQRAKNALSQAKATTSYEQFGQLAERISDDDFRVMMGDHRLADRSKLPPVVVNALLAMQPGQVSNIIEFDANAFTILRLNAHNPSHVESFETVKDSLRANLEKNKVEQLRRDLATKLSQSAKIEKA
jgi:hypothetical protein